MKRVEYLDTLRGLAIFFMIMQHAFLVHEVGAGDSTHFLSVFFVALGTWPAAPVFMVILGVFLFQSKKPNASLMVRGVKLFLLGYLLNFVRFTIPLWLANDPQAFELLFEIDILQLAGLSFILLSGLRKLAHNRYLFPILIAVIIIVSPYLWIEGNYFLDPILGGSSLVSFPVFPWIIYPMMGMYLSNVLLNLDKSSMTKLLITGLLLFIIGIFTLGNHTIYDYPKHTFDVHLIIMGFVIFYFIFIHLITKRFGFPKVLSIWSVNITNIYIIQWIVFGYSILILNANQYGPYVSTLIGFVVLIAVHFIITKTKITQYMPKV